MKVLLRLYPRSWRRRYGHEMEALLEDMPGQIGVGLDLVWGAAAAYAAVIRGNRVLSAAGAYLHGVTVAVLLQAIAFVVFVLYAEHSGLPTALNLGSVHFALFYVPWLFEIRSNALSSMLAGWPTLMLLPELGLLAVLFAVLVAVVAAPRLIRALR